MNETGREHALTAGELRLACRLWGDPHTGQPTLALHGWMDNAASFDALAAELPEQQWCALDLPGHGLSAHRPPGTAYHFVDYVTDALRAADALGWERFVIIGHSMGAGIATLLSAVAPERVHHAVLIEGLGPETTPPVEAPSVLRHAIAQSLRAERSSATVYANFDDAVRARMAGAIRLSERAARALCERGLERTTAGYAWRSDRRLRDGSRLRLTEEHALAFIRRMTVPTLLIRAESGYAIDEQRYRARIAAHPHLQVERLAGTHHLHMEAEAAHVAKLIRSFLATDVTVPRPADAL